MLAGIIVLT